MCCAPLYQIASMKPLILILFLHLFSNCYCQVGNDSLINFSSVLTVDSTSQKELALRARQWFSNTFKNPKDVLQVNDLDNGEISGNASFQYSAVLKSMGVEVMTVSTVTTKISIWTKDGKYKYQIGPFSVEMTSAYAKGLSQSSPSVSYPVTTSNARPGTE